MRIIVAAALLIASRSISTGSAGDAAPRIEYLVVPPYLEMIVFDVFRAAEGASVDVFPPGSTDPLRDGDDGVETVRLGAVLEALAVTRPRPGRWVVRKSHVQSRVRIRSQHFLPRGVLLQPNAATLASSPERIVIAYQVLDELDEPLEELLEHPLSLSVTLAAPDGSRSTLPMQRDATLGRAAFRTIEPASCTVPGRYWTDVRVTTSDAVGRRFEILRDRWAGFTFHAARVRAAAAASPRAAPTTMDVQWTEWVLPATAVALAGAVAVVRFCKTKTAASCLSDRSRQDEP